MPDVYLGARLLAFFDRWASGGDARREKQKREMAYHAKNWVTGTQPPQYNTTYEPGCLAG